MSLLKMEPVILGCLLVLAVIHSGDCIKCYVCSGALTGDRLCFDPFDGSKAGVSECPGACFKASATINVPGIGSDGLMIRACDPTNKETCSAIQAVMRNKVAEMGASGKDFSCFACTNDLCNSGHLASPSAWVSLLTLGAVGLFLRT